MNLLKGLLATIVILVVLAIIGIFATVGWWTSTYNTLVSYREATDTSFGLVQSQYQRRFDLIPNLVSTVKGAASHEEDTLVKVTQARSQIQIAGAAIDTAKAEHGDDQQKHLAAAQTQFIVAQQSLTTALSGIKVENYPTLQANQNFLALMDEIAGTENRISTERRNNQIATQRYNTLIDGFFSGIVANHYHFTSRPYFSAVAGADVAPKVDFGK